MLNLFPIRSNSSSFSRPTRRGGIKKRILRAVENLESRQLLASDVIISEVLSSNDSSIQDEDGGHADWIELYNAGHEQADLTGFHLTDDLDDRTKWQIPTLTLKPGESFIVFASGKDRAVPGTQLHTNFKLSRDGEYLALYEPDGRTVAYEFNTLPQQYTDVSFGTGQVLVDRTLVRRGDGAKVLTPSSAAEDIAAAAWTSPEFDDATWTDADNQLGFDADATDGDFSPLIGATGDIGAMRGATSSAYIRNTFHIEGDFRPSFQELQLNVNYDDGFIAFLNGGEILRVNAPENLAWDATATDTHGGIADVIAYPDFANARIQNEFTVLGDASFVDGGVLRLTPAAADQNGAAWRTDPVQFGADFTFEASMVFDVHSPGGGLPNGDSDGIGGEGMTFVLQSNDNNVLGLGGKSLGLENTGSTFLAIELDSQATGAFDPDNTLASHLGINTNTTGNIARTAIRRFNGNAFFDGNPAPETSGFQYLWVEYSGETNMLDVFYSTDGVQPADPTLSANIDLATHFSDSPSLFAGWTATTTGAFNGHDVHSFNVVTGVGELGRDVSTFDLNSHIDKLQTGTNVLAFHGLNISADDEDFLLVPELRAKEIGLTEDVGYFNTPTPWALNGEPSLAPSDGVTISKTTSVFINAFDVTITADNAGAEIRYTLDGKVPDETSPIYEGPISITETSRLRARAFEPNRSGGPITTVGYTRLDASLSNFEENHEFQSNLPLIIIDSHGNRRVNSDDRRLIPSTGIFIDPGADGVASILDNPEYSGRAGMRIRGQSSQGWAKKQYALEIWQEDEIDDSHSRGYVASDVSDKAVSIFGLPVESDWVLNGPYSDKTQLNNYLTFNWFNEIGTYAPRTKLVEVFVNDRGDDLDFDSDYRGTYVLLEKIKIDKNRVDITPMEPDDTTEPDITGGYIWKKDKDGANDYNFRTDRQNLKMVEPQRGVVTDQQVQWLDDYITSFERALYGNNFTDPNVGYAAYIDVDSWIDTWLMVEMTKNIDGFRLSTYYFKDRGGKIQQGPAWDYNLALGNGNYLNGANPEGWYHTGINNDQYPYWGRLFEDPAFEQKVADRWTELRRTVFTTDELLKDIDEAVDLISNSNPNLDNPAAGESSNPISRNFQRWTTRQYGTGVYHWPNCFFGQGGCPTSPLPNRARPQEYGDYIFIMKWFVENRVSWMDEQLVPEIVATPRPGLVEAGTQVTLEAPEGFDVYYTTNGDDPQQPLLIIENEIVLDGNASATYMVPTSNSMVQQCDGFPRLNNPELCFMNPDYVEGANGETWTAGTLGLGYDTGSDFDAAIHTDIEGVVKGMNSSVYVRIPFELTEQQIDNASDIKLDVKYDDGFEAFLWLRSLKVPLQVAKANTPGAAKRFPINVAQFNASAVTNRSDADALAFESFSLLKERNNLREGTNHLVVQLMNDNRNSDDLLFDIRISVETTTETVSPEVNRYEGPITINENSEIFARAFNPNTEKWIGGFRGNYVTVAPDLAITEVNYNPGAPTAEERAAMPGIQNDDFEFIEIRNVGAAAADLIGSKFDQGIEYEIGNAVLEPGEFAILVKNQPAFELRYGNELNVLGQFAGSLDNNGETISLVGVSGNPLSSFRYDDSGLWPQSADGVGATLELVDASLVDKFYSWQASSVFGGTPGAAASSPIGVVVNEVLSNSGDQEDAIELLNTTDGEIDASGWFISDSANNLRKYQLPEGTKIGANQYFVISETAFNADPNDPNSFGLNGDSGDDVWITIADGDVTQSFVDDVHFEGSLAGESHGRIPNGSGRLAPMSPTLGTVNANPRIGPVMITEVNYNPGTPSEAALAIDPLLSQSDLEFIEIHNRANESRDMTDWRLRGGADLNFGIDVSIAANETVVFTPFNPDSPLNSDRLAAFREHYGIGENVRLMGPLQGELNGSYDRVTLLSRDSSRINEPIVLPLILEDEVVYDDLAPWPSDADGTGASLQRRAPDGFGNSATSWIAASPSPGQVGFSGPIGDFNEDGVVDVTDITLLCGSTHEANPHRQFDLNGDGVVDIADHETMIENILGTTHGDANLDGIFNSADLVLIFQAGEYEDEVVGNSNWATGDWNCDGEFTSRDLVRAFIAGGYTLDAVADDQIAAALDHGLNSDQPAEDKDLDEQDIDGVHARPVEFEMATQELGTVHDRIFGEQDNALEIDVEDNLFEEIT